MNKKQLARNLIFAGGVAELLVAALHFVMPLSIVHTEAISGLPLAYQQYVIHATIAIGLCMTTFGTLSIYFSQEQLRGARTAWMFCLSQGILWLARILSELALPVRVPLFFLINPTTIILPMVIGIALLFLIPALALRKEMLATDN